MGRRILWLISAIFVLGIVLLVFFLVRPSEKVCVITCTNDSQCGGDVEGLRFCKGNSLYVTAQANACNNAGTCESVCGTTFVEKLVEECTNRCIDGACV